MTTLTPGANWYEDPSGRHEGRFWDGFSWTAHVFDAGVAAIDPPLAAQPAPVSAPDGTAGHGTRQLEAMRTQAAITARADAVANGTAADDPAPDRRTVLGMTIPSLVGLAVFAVITAAGISATGILQPGSGTPPAIATTVPVTGAGYTAQVPLGWANAAAPPGSLFDAAYSVPGLEPVVVGIGNAPLTEGQVADPVSRAAALDFVAQGVAGSFGQVARISDHATRVLGGRTVDVITVEVNHPEGGTGYVTEYVIVGPDRSVVVAASGSEGAVAQHQSRLAATARSIRFAPPG